MQTRSMLVDSHCHLDLPELAGNLNQILDSMQLADVGCAVCIGVTLEDFPRLLSIAETCPRVFATVGVHPENTGVQEPSVDDLVTLAGHPRVIVNSRAGLTTARIVPDSRMPRASSSVAGATSCPSSTASLNAVGVASTSPAAAAR